MIVLVTGAAGRVGRHLVPALLRSRDEVRVLVKDMMVKDENVEVFYGDLLNKESLEKAVKGVDAVFHLAAAVDYSTPNDQMFKVNVVGTKNLLEVSKGKRFIYLSSTAVMGNKFKELPLNEETSCKPSNFYGKTKLEAEGLVKEAGGIIIRSTDVFGPDFREGYDYIISGLENGNMPVIGDGKNFIQWIHVKDLVQALVLAKNMGKPGQVYIVAGKEFKTLNQLWSLLCKYLEVEPPKKKVSKFLAKTIARSKSLTGKITGKKNELIPEYIDKITASRTFDLTKAKTELGFDPQIGYDEAAREMINEYKKESNEKQEEVTEEQSEQQG
ncbi:MAG: NAD-dependent epimerase/dehydratase family protein [Candidatus Aenigmatarchaeota archaeon]